MHAPGREDRTFALTLVGARGGKMISIILGKFFAAFKACLESFSLPLRHALKFFFCGMARVTPARPRHRRDPKTYDLRSDVPPRGVCQGCLQTARPTDVTLLTFVSHVKNSHQDPPPLVPFLKPSWKQADFGDFGVSETATVAWLWWLW